MKNHIISISDVKDYVKNHEVTIASCSTGNKKLVGTLTGYFYVLRYENREWKEHYIGKNLTIAIDTYNELS